MTSPKGYASSSNARRLHPNDPIAGAISLLRPRTVIEPGLHAAGPWAVRFDPFPYVKLGVVVTGECWLSLDGQEPVLLREGDFYLLGNPPSYELATSLSAEPRPAGTLWGDVSDGMVRIGGVEEEDTYLCGGYFSFDDTNASMLIDVLPPLVHLRAGEPRGQLLTNLMALLIPEVESGALGSSFILEHLVQILLVHMLRAHAVQAGRPSGWLGALNDDGVGAALRAIHSDVAHRWTLEGLASVGHMSRSVFAAAFRKQVGSAPLEYVINWRMSLARDELHRRTRSISELAFMLGYQSESAFSTAFRREHGSSPRQFRDATGLSRAADGD